MTITTRSQYAALCNDTYHDKNYMNPESIGFVTTLGEIKDTRYNVFGSFFSFGVDELNGVGLGKMGVSIFGEEADLFKDVINTGEFKALFESMQLRNDD